jgi:hypothetical protein
MTAFSRSTDPGAQTLVPNLPSGDDIAPHLGFSGVYSPTIPSLQHLPPPPSATPATFLGGTVGRTVAETTTGKVQGVMGLTQPLVATTRKAGRSGADRIQGEAMRLVANVRARFQR